MQGTTRAGHPKETRATRNNHYKLIRLCGPSCQVSKPGKLGYPEGLDLHDAAVMLGRKGGQSRSPAKAAAARRNGLKGGRPRRLWRLKNWPHFVMQNAGLFTTGRKPRETK